MRLRENKQALPAEPPVRDAALVIAPAAIGCAVGLLLADKLKGESRSSLASTLLTLGTLAALPLAIGLADKALNNPARESVSRRRLRRIRESGPEADIVGGDEYFLEQHHS